MTQEDILKILEEHKVIIQGHFRLASGRHSDTYVRKDTLYLFPSITSMLCSEIAKAFREISMREKIEAVVGPEKGGIILSQWTAYFLSFLTQRVIHSAFAEKVFDKETGGEIFQLRRGYDEYIRGKQTVVVEDVLTTGGSVKKVIAALHKINCTVLGVGALWNRGGVSAEELGVSVLFSLVNIGIPSWDPKKEECPLCDKGIPLDANF